MKCWIGGSGGGGNSLAGLARGVLHPENFDGESSFVCVYCYHGYPFFHFLLVFYFFFLIWLSFRSVNNQMMNFSTKQETMRMMIEIVHLRTKKMSWVAFLIALSSCCYNC